MPLVQRRGRSLLLRPGTSQRRIDLGFYDLSLMSRVSRQMSSQGKSNAITLQLLSQFTMGGLCDLEKSISTPEDYYYFPA